AVRDAAVLPDILEAGNEIFLAELLPRPLQKLGSELDRLRHSGCLLGLSLGMVDSFLVHRLRSLSGCVQESALIPGCVIVPARLARRSISATRSSICTPPVFSNSRTAARNSASSKVCRRCSSISGGVE